RVLSEEVFADVRAILRFEVLVLAIDALLHAFEEDPVGVAGEQLVPAGAPDDFEDVPAGATEDSFELLDDLAVAADRTVQALEIAIDDENEVVETLAPCEGDGAERFGLIRLAVAEERPDLAVGGISQTPGVEVFEKARLINRGDRPQAHRDGR